MTVADGSCALHALFGNPNDLPVRLADPKAQRQIFSRWLQENLKKDRELEDLYQMHITDLIELGLAPIDPTNLLSRSAHSLIEKSAVLKAALERYKESIKFEEKHRECLDLIIDPKPEMLAILKGDSPKSDDDFLRDLQTDKDFLVRRVYQHLKALKDHFIGDLSASFAITELEELAEEEQAIRDALIKSDEFFEAFIQAIEDPSYWLSDLELEMAAHMDDLRVEIVTYYAPDGMFVCNNQERLPPRDQDERAHIIILCENGHYTRCQFYNPHEDVDEMDTTDSSTEPEASQIRRKKRPSTEHADGSGSRKRARLLPDSSSEEEEQEGVHRDGSFVVSDDHVSEDDMDFKTEILSQSVERAAKQKSPFYQQEFLESTSSSSDEEDGQMQIQPAPIAEPEKLSPSRPSITLPTQPTPSNESLFQQLRMLEGNPNSKLLLHNFKMLFQGGFLQPIKGINSIAKFKQIGPS